MEAIVTNRYIIKAKYAISEDFKYENPEQIKDFDKIKFLRKDIKMTEQEIVSYLKENRTKGVAFGFMPVEVGDWIKANRKKLMGKLICFSDTFGWGAVNTDKPILSLDYIFALPEDFKPEEKPQENGWIEFDIDENECYRILDTDMRFHWSEWNKPLWIINFRGSLNNLVTMIAPPFQGVIFAFNKDKKMLRT